MGREVRCWQCGDFVDYRDVVRVTVSDRMYDSPHRVDLCVDCYDRREEQAAREDRWTSSGWFWFLGGLGVIVAAAILAMWVYRPTP